MSLSDLLPESWKDSLSNHLQDIDKIGMELQNRADSGETILPNKSLVFRALEVPVNKVKVVIVGQDPYPNPKDACGLAFSVAPRFSGLPGSLMNIQKEILTDIGSSTTADGDLTRWMEHGVLLLMIGRKINTNKLKMKRIPEKRNSSSQILTKISRSNIGRMPLIKNPHPKI